MKFQIPIIVDSGRGPALIHVRPRETTIRDVIKMVHKFDDFEFEFHRIRYNGRELDEDKTLLYYDITEPNTFLYLSLQFSPRQ